MNVSIFQIVSLILVSAIAGGAAGYLVATALGSRRIRHIGSESTKRTDELIGQRAELQAELSNARSTIESLEASVKRNRTKLGSAVKKAKKLAQNILALRAEREDTKVKVGTLQSTLVSVKQQTLALQREFEKAGEFYKRELAKSLDKRKALESEVREARSEQEAFSKMVEESVLEHGSPKEMITAAQLRLGQIKVLERSVEKLEAENTELRADAARLMQEYGAVQKSLEELEELRINNQQLVRCVESLESSRKQQEQVAEEHRARADESEQLSETLRLRLDDLQQSFADIEEQQNEAIKHARKATALPSPNSPSDNDDVVDLASYSRGNS